MAAPHTPLHFATEHEFIVLNNELDRKRAEVKRARTELEATQTELDAKQAEVNAKQAEVDAKQAVQELSKALYEAGRIDEYIAALDDSTLMAKLLQEFGLA